MAARAKSAVAFFVLLATTWLLFDSGAVDGFLAKVAGAREADSPALRGVRRLQGGGPGSFSGTPTYGYETSSGSSGASGGGQMVGFGVGAGWQLIYGVIYYFIIVQEYPELQNPPTEQAQETQSKNEFMAFITCENSFTINLTSCLCWGARAAHTYDKLGLLSYWPGLFLSSCFPVCTLFYMNCSTDLNEKLGGEKRECCQAFLCAWFCPVCVIAQDAQSLDECTGAVVRLCHVDMAGATE